MPVMVDWLSLLHIPCHHDPKKLYFGCQATFDENGDVTNRWDRPKPVKGSFDNQIVVKTDLARSAGTHIEISGNPAKFFQGHNLFGSDDVFALSVAIILRVVKGLSLEPTPADIEMILEGLFSISRVDLTASWLMSSREQVRTAIQALSRYAYAQNRGRGSLTKEGTVYWGKHSRYWTLKGYCKGDEITAKNHGIDPNIPLYETLTAHADKLLRVELCLRGKQLKTRLKGGAIAANWERVSSESVFQEFIDRLQIPDNAALPSNNLDGLPNRLKIPYTLWMEGYDLRDKYKKSTIYRYRRELLKHGIDIFVLRSREPDTADKNLVLLKNLLKAPSVAVPDWAIGTPCFFDAKARLGANSAELAQTVTPPCPSRPLE